LTAQRFDIHTLAVVLPIVVLVTLGLTTSVLNLTYNFYHEEKNGVEVRAWWDGDHADIYVKVKSEELLPALVEVREFIEEKNSYQPTKHILRSLVISSTDSPLFITSAVTSKNFEIIVLTSQKDFVFKIRLR
jgi:hypothetical protein